MKKTFAIAAMWALPAFALAQGLKEFVTTIGGVVNLLVPLTSTLAVVFFFYGLAKFILNSGDEEKRKEGKSIMIWGILAMFVLVTIWGIIAFMQTSLGNDQAPTVNDVTLPAVNANDAG
jgi:uncharacterized membrane-anchored protein